MEQQTFTISIFTENQVGLLNQIAIIFTRRHLNIDNISASASSIPSVHKILITCRNTRRMMEHVVKQLERRVDVLKAFLYTDDDIVFQEVALYKVTTAPLLAESKIEEIIRRNGARVLDITPDYTVFEKTGHTSETEQLFNELLPYGLRQFVRSGRVAVTRSPEELVDRYIAEQQVRLRETESKNNII